MGFIITPTLQRKHPPRYASFSLAKAARRVTGNELGGIAEYKNRVTNRSQKWGAPVLEPLDGRRDDFMYPYFKQARPDQVVAILRAREPGRILVANGNKS